MVFAAIRVGADEGSGFREERELDRRRSGENGFATLGRVVAGSVTRKSGEFEVASW